jgi:uncharacterized protein (DUF488 family)
VRVVADVRRFPRSRRHPHFNAEVLAEALPGYEQFPSLGGRRRPVPDSVNDGWEVEAFRGYADHMASAEFLSGLARLEELAASVPTAVMCAEAPWWRCHRRLVADALLVRGWEVCHIGPDGRLVAHEVPDFAVVDGVEIRYPAPQLRL